MARYNLQRYTDPIKKDQSDLKKTPKLHILEGNFAKIFRRSMPLDSLK